VHLGQFEPRSLCGIEACSWLLSATYQPTLPWARRCRLLSLRGIGPGLCAVGERLCGTAPYALRGTYGGSLRSWWGASDTHLRTALSKNASIRPIGRFQQPTAGSCGMSGWVAPRIRTSRYAMICMRLRAIMAYSQKHCATTFWCFMSLSDGRRD
jgi:hypothetical protein